MEITSNCCFYFSPQDIQSANGQFECRVWIIPAEEGGFTCFSPSLPGVVSEGETFEEAITNIREALRGAIQVYLEDQRPIPWSPLVCEAPPAGTIEKWILVDVS
ncbi:MAG TPA: type II toxin-antitoxin system HicB family antitoxin [Thermoguttaceae bacterium]|nr:type II toxin-antitoxin system HicB family antitoxin [Thermoguttaceae bacterium]HPP51438.1 type II toxin-antitoxin system HicB family antitoxin [Thermoguttaceae bacterium]